MKLLNVAESVSSYYSELLVPYLCLLAERNIRWDMLQEQSTKTVTFQRTCKRCLRYWLAV